MGVWTERIENSQILVKLRELGAAVDKAVGRDDNTDDEVESIERIRTVLTVIGKRLHGADGHLLLASSLENLASEISNATGALHSFADGNRDQLANANLAMDRALAVFGSFVIPTTTEDLAGLREAATAYRTTMARELDLWGNSASHSRERIDELEKKVGSVDERITTEGDRLSGVVKAIEDGAGVASTQLREAYDAATKKLDADHVAKLSEWQTAFDTAEKTRAEAHKAEEEGQIKTFDALAEKHEGILTTTDSTWNQKLSDAHAAHSAALSKLHTDYEQKAAAIISTMEEQLKRVQELVGAIGDHGVTAGFKREADDARQEVIYWQRVTFWSMVFLILVGVATAFHVFEYKLTWISLASRLYLSIATGVLAAYAASQASRYQQRERRNRKLELELRALGPFLEPVDRSEREKFRLKIAEVFFGRDDEMREHAGPSTSYDLVKGTVDKALDLGTTMAKKLPGRGD